VLDEARRGASGEGTLVLVDERCVDRDFAHVSGTVAVPRFFLTREKQVRICEASSLCHELCGEDNAAMLVSRRPFAEDMAAGFDGVFSDQFGGLRGVCSDQLWVALVE
jgi:hypothetical protein